MRRRIAFLALAAALLAAAPAGAQLVPVKRHGLPRLRAGVVHVPRGHASGRVRVIVTLKLPPLAAAFHGRVLTGATTARRLDVRSTTSRAYLARVAEAQRSAVVRLRRAMPSARVSRRFRIVLDGLTVTLPVQRLPKLVRLGFVRRVYPSLRFTLTLDRSPSLIGADVLHAATGARGQGVKIGVVDDGVDQTNPFFNPAGFAYPAGFPKGDAAFTTPKVIVARAFPGPGSGARGRLPLDRQESFHGTHVAGIAAGAVPGEPTLPSPKSSRSFPAAITGTTPAAATFLTVSISASVAGSLSGPPPEKLITFMPSATADSNAAMISGVSAISPPSGVGTLNTR